MTSDTTELGELKESIETGSSVDGIAVTKLQEYVRVTFAPKRSLFVQPKTIGLMVRLTYSNIDRYNGVFVRVLKRECDHKSNDRNGLQTRWSWHGCSLSQVIDVVNAVAEHEGLRHLV